MAGIIVTRENRYIGEHTCPQDAYETANRQAFYDLQVRNGRENLITVNLDRESCYDFAIRMNEQAKRVAFSRHHPAYLMLEAAYNHLNEEDTARFNAENAYHTPSMDY